MINPDHLFSFANIIFIVASLDNIKILLKSRHSLRGFSKVGAFLTFSAIIVLCIAYYIQEFYLSMFTTLPTLLFWIGVTWYAK